MKRISLFATILMMAIVLATPENAQAQKRQIVNWGGRLLRSLVEKAIVTATLNEIKEYYQETPADMAPVKVTITNNYNSTQYIEVFDGNNWYSYSLYPGYYASAVSTYQGAIVVYYDGDYYMVGTSGSYRLSNF
ncbi:MAG TPA: hypothetical protein VK168_13575 [Saprospiraceae bacterium]|nr:hypothetical protein [Saprospiraceae bacterium]